MRSKTFVLGMLSMMFVAFATLFISAADTSANPGVGYNPGEKMPSIKVDDIDLQDISADDATLVVLWSKRDAKSRMVNSWLSSSSQDRKVVSICVDADTEEARLYADIDGVSEDVTVKGGNQSEELIKALGMTKGLKSLVVENGVIVETNTVAMAWDQLANTESKFSER